MPQKKRIDPYGFVPLFGTVLRENVSSHGLVLADRHHGRFVCRLTTKTPLFVSYDPTRVTSNERGHEEVRFPVFDGVAVIPGSSLKGAIRSVVEAVEPSCLVFPDGGEHSYRGAGITRGQEVRVRIPPEFRRCGETVAGGDRKLPGRLCPACRLFGAVHREWAWAGKVSISDARSKPGEYSLMPLQTLGVLSAPKPEARQRTYLKGDGSIVGRKFYRHRLDPVVTRAIKDRQNKTVEPVAPKATFHFTADYINLSDAELATLLYGLFLEEGLWHKVGMGKPLGLGSAHIEPVRWERRDATARYRTLGGGMGTPVEGEALNLAVAERVTQYRETKDKPDQTPNLKALREILQSHHDWDVSYPPPPPSGAQSQRPPSPSPPFNTPTWRPRR